MHFRKNSFFSFILSVISASFHFYCFAVMGQELEEQIQIFQKASSIEQKEFLNNHPEIIYISSLHVPDNISVEGDTAYRLIAKKTYQKGDIVFENTSLIFDSRCHLLINFKERLFFIDNLKHTVNRGGDHREFYYFDSFMNHSCDPNTHMLYSTKTHYQCIALKSIVAGDELTCDYAVFDTEPDGEGFNCECGSSTCRGFMKDH